MTRILQLTDLHVFSTPGATLKGIPTRECLEDVVGYIQANEHPFDHVVITGDHTHDEQRASYEAVRSILTPWHECLWQVPGNHDDRLLLRQVFPCRSEDGPGGTVNFVFPAGHWLCIGLDTHWPGEVAGVVEDQQLNWLQEILQQASQEDVALFMHHPPVSVGSVWMDAIGLNNRERLEEIIRADPRIRLVCCGHVHHEFQLRLHQADIVATPSTGIQFSPAGTSPQFADESPGYRVIELNEHAFTTRVHRLPVIKYHPAPDA